MHSLINPKGNKNEMAELLTAVCNLPNQGWFRKITNMALIFKQMDHKIERKTQQAAQCLPWVSF